LALDLVRLLKGQIQTDPPSFKKLIAQYGKTTDFAFNLFLTYVAYEKGAIREEVLCFIQGCLNPIMSPLEWEAFILRIIEHFLSQPHTHFS